MTATRMLSKKKEQSSTIEMKYAMAIGPATACGGGGGLLVSGRKELSAYEGGRCVLGGECVGVWK